MKTILTAILLIAILTSSCNSYRVKHEIHEYKDVDVFDNNCKGEVSYDVYYNVWIYKGLEPVKPLIQDHVTFCKQNYDNSMNEVNNTIAIYEHIGDSLIKNVPKQ
jgi:hypothetical protein